jgi:hypothetical protein
MDSINQWHHTIEPMIWVNPGWWFCQDCYPDFPNKTPLLPTGNHSGFIENMINLTFVNKSKPYGK